MVRVGHGVSLDRPRDVLSLPGLGGVLVSDQFDRRDVTSLPGRGERDNPVYEVASIGGS
jgi:hypothetical protein